MRPERIAVELRRAMLAGEIAPGAELIQAELAERFAVSRIPIRDALRLLAENGLVEIEPNRGARVITLSAEEVAELFDLRILLECDCLKRAAVRIDAAMIAQIDRIRRKSDLDAATPEWSAGDWRFHEALYAPARRPRQTKLIEGLRQTCELFVAAYRSLPDRTSDWLRDHALIVEALARGDTGSAEVTLRRHLEAAKAHLVAAMTGER